MDLLSCFLVVWLWLWALHQQQDLKTAQYKLQIAASAVEDLYKVTEPVDTKDPAVVIFSTTFDNFTADSAADTREEVVCGAPDEYNAHLRENKIDWLAVFVSVYALSGCCFAFWCLAVEFEEHDNSCQRPECQRIAAQLKTVLGENAKLRENDTRAKDRFPSGDSPRRPDGRSRQSSTASSTNEMSRAHRSPPSFAPTAPRSMRENELRHAGAPLQSKTMRYNGPAYPPGPQSLPYGRRAPPDDPSYLPRRNRCAPHRGGLAPPPGRFDPPRNKRLAHSGREPLLRGTSLVRGRRGPVARAPAPRAPAVGG